MNFSLKSVLRSTIVLYIVFFLALVNFFSYIMAHNYNAVVVFLVLGVITRYLFSKNMIIILLASLILTNVIMSVSFLRKTIEGMEDKAIEGAENTIDKHRPICYMEITKTNSEAIFVF